MADSSTLVDRVKIFVESSGTGPFQLGNALPSFRGSEALTDGLTYSYAVESGSDYEVGQGVYVLAVDQLIRSPTLSSNGGAPVSFPANVAVNFTALATDLTAGLAGSGTVTSVQGSGGTTGLTLTGGPITGAGTLTLGGTLGLANGGTGGTDGPTARAGIGLGNVDNTSDLNKPVSNAVTALLLNYVSYIALAAAAGSISVGYQQSGTDSRLRTANDKFEEIRSILDKEGGIADGATSNVAAFEAAVADGGVWRVPKQADPYVLDASLAWADVEFVFDDGVEILWTGGIAADYDYVVLAGNNLKLSCNGQWSVISAAADQKRFSVLIEAKDGVTIQGLRSVNMCRVWSKSSTGATPTDPDVYADVVTSGVGANVTTNLLIDGGGCEFDVQPTGPQTHAADSIFYTVGWEVRNSRYTRVTSGIQWWGGDANGDGAVTNDRKCVNGLIRNCHVEGSLGGGLWGSMGLDFMVNESSAKNCEDVGLDAEGSFNVSFNDCVGSNGARGSGACFYFNRGITFNDCHLIVDDAANDVFRISNVAQSIDNRDITFNNCTFECTDTAPSRIVPAAVKELTFNNCTFRNVLVTVAALNNHITTIQGGKIVLPYAGGTPASPITVNDATDVITHSIPNLAPMTRVRFSTTGTLPAGISAGTDYFVTPITGTTCKISTSVGNAAKAAPVYVNITSAGSGTNTMTVALSAIDAGGNNLVSGVSGKCIIDGIKIFSEIAQPSGSMGVFVAQYDANGSPVTLVKNILVSNMPADIDLRWGGDNGSTSGQYVISECITGNVITISQDNAAAVMTFSQWDNRTPGGVMFNRAANIPDPAGGATVDAEARTAINAILSVLEAQGFTAP